MSEAQRRKQQMDGLLAAGAANGHSLMVLQMDDLAGLLQRLQGGLANGTQALSNSLHAQTTTIEAMASQLKAALAENARLTARVAELEKQNLGIRQFDAQVLLQGKKLDHDAKTRDEMMGLIKVAAATMLSRRGGAGVLSAVGEFIGGESGSGADVPGEAPSAPEARPAALAATAPGPAQPAPAPVKPQPEQPRRAPAPATAAKVEVRSPLCAPAEVATCEPARAEIPASATGSSGNAGAAPAESIPADEPQEQEPADEVAFEEEEEQEEDDADGVLPESLTACAKLAIRRLSRSTLDHVLECAEKPSPELKGIAPIVAAARVVHGCSDEQTRHMLEREAGPELVNLLGPQGKVAGEGLGACAQRIVRRLSPAVLDRVLACMEPPHPRLNGSTPIDTLVRLILGCCDDEAKQALQDEVGPELQDHMAVLIVRAMTGS